MLIDQRKTIVIMLHSTCFILVAMLHPYTALAGEIELSMPNDAEGHIYLTQESCDINPSTPDAIQLHRAYSVALEGTDKEQLFEGCWMSPELNLGEIPAEYREKAQRVVVIYTDSGMQFSQLLSDFTPNAQNAGTMVGQF